MTDRLLTSSSGQEFHLMKVGGENSGKNNVTWFILVFSWPLRGGCRLHGYNRMHFWRSWAVQEEPVVHVTLGVEKKPQKTSRQIIICADYWYLLEETRKEGRTFEYCVVNVKSRLGLHIWEAVLNLFPVGTSICWTHPETGFIICNLSIQRSSLNNVKDYRVQSGWEQRSPAASVSSKSKLHLIYRNIWGVKVTELFEKILEGVIISQLSPYSIFYTILTAGYVCPTLAPCRVISMLRSSSVVFRYTGLSKFMLFWFFSCQFRHIR